MVAAAVATGVAGGCGSSFSSAETDPGAGRGNQGTGADHAGGSGAAGENGTVGLGGSPDGSGGVDGAPPGGGGRGGAVGNSPPVGGEPSTDPGGSGGAGAGGAGSGGKGGGGGAGGAGSGGKGGGGGAGGQPPLPPPIVKAYDDFLVSAAAWTVTGDPDGGTVTHLVEGGNPYGTISFTDGNTPSWYFTAPAKYLGDASALVGGVLRFDLKVTAVEEPFGSADVQLTNGELALTLSYDCTPDPTTSWKTYTVPLSAGGWRVGTSLSGTPATAEQLRSVLSKLTTLRIRGEFNTGADTGWLDNVYFASRLPD